MPEPAKTEGTVEIFCSYSHMDDELRQEFEKHVVMLRRQKLVQIWHDHRILAGDDWAGEIDEHLNSAEIVTLFVSADFLASDYCYDKEVKRAMEREELKEALVAPIIVRPCDWTDAPFGGLQAIPTGAKPVTTWANRDEAWTDVAKLLKLTVKEVLQRMQAKIKAEVTATLPNVDIEELLQQEARRSNWKISRDYLVNTKAMDRLRIMQELQAKVFAIEQEIAPPGRKSADEAFKEMDKYIRDN